MPRMKKLTWVEAPSVQEHDGLQRVYVKDDDGGVTELGYGKSPAAAIESARRTLERLAKRLRAFERTAAVAALRDSLGKKIP